MGTINLKLFSLLLLLSALVPNFVVAQEAVTLSISPTLYDMSAEPGQSWSGSLKIVNVNPFDLTVYAEVVNFEQRGETGEARFIPILDAERDGSTMAEWFTVPTGAIVVPREQSYEIPITVHFPLGASPGGHYAAILVGTKPIRAEDGQAKLQTAQMVTSLFFARIAGDVNESGTIREFTTTKGLLGTPEATFTLRFENKGNVHLQPRGDIVITNMWGEERGVIPINQYTDYGKVLPESTRNYSFTWKGDWSIADIGRYTAVATLGYGEEEKQFSSSKTYFWVLPIMLLLGVFFGLALFFGLLTWLVRMYVRHMLTMAGIGIEDFESVRERAQSKTSVRQKPALHAPLEAGILDLTKRMQASVSLLSRLRELLQFVMQYRYFFLGVILIIGFVLALIWYIQNANTEHRAYEVTYIESGDATSTPVSSEEILYNELKAKQETPSASLTSSTTVHIVNRSGVPGTGADARLMIEGAGYNVASLAADFDQIQERTVIVSSSALYTDAIALSKLLSNAPVSLSDEAEHADTVTIYIGSDMSL